MAALLNALLVTNTSEPPRKLEQSLRLACNVPVPLDSEASTDLNPKP